MPSDYCLGEFKITPRRIINLKYGIELNGCESFYMM